jgi:hypothetical protein
MMQRTIRALLLAIMLALPGAFAALPTPQQLRPDSATVKAIPGKPGAHGADSVRDTFDIRSGTLAGIGIGFSLGSLPPFDIWRGGLPQQLSDLGLTDTSYRIAPAGLFAGDTGQLSFTVRQSPDLYSITFPITAYITRLTPNHRFTASLSFAWLSEEYDARILEQNDSSQYFDLQQTLGLYSLTGALTWGTRIPERYFSVDAIDRTDALIGLLATPYIALRRTTSIGAPPAAGSRMDSLYHAVLPQMSSFSAAGIAYGWRLSLATIRHQSKRSGLEAELTYSGIWNTGFHMASGATLLQANLGDKSATAGNAVSYYTSRIEISISLFRKIF